MNRYGVVSYNEGKMIEWALPVGGLGYAEYTPLWQGGRGADNPFIIFFHRENEAQQAAAYLAGVNPGIKFVVFTINEQWLSKPAEAKSAKVTEKGILPS